MFLVLAARKLQLKREINLKNYQQLLIQDQLTAATKKVQDFQQYMNDAKQMTNIFAQAAGNQFLQSSLNNNNFAAGDASQIQAATQTATIATNQMVSAVSSVANSIFDQANKVQLAKLQAQQSALDLKNEALKSQVQLLTGEYDEVKKNEDAAAKSCAPQFAIA